MKVVARSSACLLALLLVALLSFGSSSSHVEKTGTLLRPESKVRRFGQKGKGLEELKSQGQYAASEKAAASIRGGSNGMIPTKGIYGVIAMAAIEAGVKKLLAAKDMKFPSMLGGCIALFVVSVLAQIVHPGWGDCIFEFLSPGAALLGKWLPSFFVPGLAILPLAPSIGSGKEVNPLYISFVHFN